MGLKKTGGPAAGTSPGAKPTPNRSPRTIPVINNQQQIPQMLQKWRTTINESLQQPQAPGNVQNFQVAPAANGNQLTWAPVTGADGFILYRSTTPGFEPQNVTQIPLTNAAANSYFDAAADATAYYKVAATSGTIAKPNSVLGKQTTVLSGTPSGVSSGTAAVITNVVTVLKSTPSAAGSDMQVQYNSVGSLAGDPNFTWDYTLGSLHLGQESSLPSDLNGYLGSVGITTLDHLIAATSTVASDLMVGLGIEAGASASTAAWGIFAAAESGLNTIGVEGDGLLIAGSSGGTALGVYGAGIATGAVTNGTIIGIQGSASGNSAGVVTAAGFYMVAVAADAVAGTGIGMWIGSTISGHITYALKSDSTAQSVFAGSIQGTVLNATTGFRVNGSATSGDYLRGNGTNIVLSAIQIGDLFSADGVTTTKFLSEAGTWLTPSGGGGGVTSLNSETGAITLVAGTNVTITPAGSNITIAANGPSASLSFSTASSPASLNLSSVGTYDWILSAGQTTAFNPPRVEAFGNVHYKAQGGWMFRSFDWIESGTGSATLSSSGASGISMTTTAGDDATSPISAVNEIGTYLGGNLNNVINFGYRFTVPAQSSTRTLVLNLGVYSCKATITCTLSDGSLAAQSTTIDAVMNGGYTQEALTITYNASTQCEMTVVVNVTTSYTTASTLEAVYFFCATLA